MNHSPVTRLVRWSVLFIVSLALSIQSIDGEKCKPVFEFYDGVVDQCQECSDICKCIGVACLTFCKTNCREYHEAFILATTPPQIPFLGRGDVPATPEQPIFDRIVPLPQNPLFWLSISCLIVAVVTTVAIVVVIVVCRSGRRESRSDPLLANQSSRTSSESSSSSSDGGKRDTSYASSDDVFPCDIPASPLPSKNYLLQV